jgi:aerobic-type carbon monoxide dehydrogenase small subunit (CoxS/CutS family)
LVVNGATRTVVADPASPLLWALRDEVGDQSPKYGCGAEQCGSCRVLVDGRPMASCTLAVGDVGSRPVTTVAGLASDPAAVAVQEALLRHNAGQCGYCLPGIVVTLTHLARSGARLDAAGVRRALDDHLCRCGAQPRIVRAALEVLGPGEGSDG